MFSYRMSSFVCGLLSKILHSQKRCKPSVSAWLHMPRGPNGLWIHVPLLYVPIWTHTSRLCWFVSHTGRRSQSGENHSTQEAFFPGPSEKTSVCCRWMWSVSRSKHFWRRFWIEQYRTTKDPLGEARKDHPSEASSFRVRSAVLRQVRDTANSHKGDKGHWLAYLHNSLVAVR